jgi:hypothetical protein
MERILHYAEQNSHPYSDITDMKKLVVTLKETFEHSTANFFILKSAILKSFQEKKLYFMNVEYEISPEEVNEYYDYFIETLKANPKISFYIINDDTLDTGFLEYKISIYCNNTTVFLKNLLKLHERSDDFFSIINNSRLVRDINLTFEELKRSSICTRYSANEMNELWEKYRSLLFQIMNIKK